jgi:hypothetical protein
VIDPQKFEEILNDCRPVATQMAIEIGEMANRMEGHAGTYAGLTASLVFQNILISLAMNRFTPGSPEGQAWIVQMYHQAIKDAAERWQQPDLKIAAEHERKHREPKP